MNQRFGPIGLVLLALSFALAPLSGATASAESGISPDLLTKPLDMMVDEAARASGAMVPAGDATASERALGLYQRGFFADARTAALEAIEAKDNAGAAMMLLAAMSENGLGTRRDDAEAVQWIERAAATGNAEARHALALRRLTGDGVAKNREAALVALRELARTRPEAAFDLAQLLLSEGESGEAPLLFAAEAGLPEAQYALGGLLMERASRNDGAAEERADALEWMVRAARSGLAEAQLELGLWLAEGRGTTADPRAAHGWIERAALAGLPLARNRLAHMHRVGIGTAADPVRAARWHALARLDGVRDGDLDRLVGGLSDQQRAEAFRGLPPRAVEAVTAEANDGGSEGAPRATPPANALPPARERLADGLPGVRLGAQ